MTNWRRQVKAIYQKKGIIIQGLNILPTKKDLATNKQTECLFEEVNFSYRKAILSETMPVTNQTDVV